MEELQAAKGHLKPFPRSPVLSVENDVTEPDYLETGKPLRGRAGCEYYTEFDFFRHGGHV